jgi:Cu-Zn family superoxide dismutase
MISKAICNLKGKKGISGIMIFSENIDIKSISIYGFIKGLNKGKHGLHIHEYGDLSNCCISAGSQ